MPTAPSPVVLVSGHADRDHRRPVRRRRLRLRAARGNGPCVTGQWVVGAMQVLSQGQPVAILTGTAVCAPTGTPLVPVSAQTLVIAT